MTRSPRRRRLALLIATALVALSPLLAFGTLYWDADGVSAGNNTSTGANLGGTANWNTAGRWFNGASNVSWSPPNDAVFTGAAGTVTLGAPQSATALTFKTNGYTITGSTLTLGPTPANITTDAGVTATIASTIAGSATMTKLGPGTLILANNSNTNTANTTEGGWRIEGGGILRISADTALGAALPDEARNTVTDIQLNQSTIQFGADMDLHINRRTKVNTNSAVQNLGDGVIDTNGHAVRWFGSIQGGFGSIRVTNSGPIPGILTLGTDDLASVNPFGSALPGGTVNLTVSNGAIVQTSGTVTPTHGELGSETNTTTGEVLAIKLEGGGQIRSESGDYTFQRNLILGTGGGSLDTGAWLQTFAGGTITGPGSLSKFGGSTLVIDNPIATWAGGTFIRSGTLQLGRSGSNGILPGTSGSPSSVVVDSGATLKFVRGSNKSFFDNISGQGGVTIANTAGRVVRLVSNNTYTGPTTITSGILMIGQGNPGEPGSIVADVLNNSSLVFNRVEDMTYAGAISGTGTVTKQAAGKLTLTGSSSYSGTTFVNAGTLVAANTVGSATGTGNVTVAASATLAGSGTVTGPVSIASSGRLAPGNSVGTMTIEDDLTNAGIIEIEVNSPTAFDRLVVEDLNAGGIVRIIAGYTPSLGDTFDLLDFASFTDQGYSFDFTQATLPANLSWDTRLFETTGVLSVHLPGDNNGDGAVDAADYVMWRKNDGTTEGFDTWRENFGETAGSGLSLGTAVPEPASFAMLLVAAMLVISAARRRR